MKQQPRFRPALRPKRLKGFIGAASLLVSTLSPGTVLAQADIAPPPPNVLLLVDTSGSMDYKTSSNSFPACHYTGAVESGATALHASERSRWIELVEVLTGSISNYDCQRLDRNSTLFKNEYSLGGVSPYDFLYPNPYNRPASSGCVLGPGTLDPNKALFPPGAVKFHPSDNTLSACPTPFSQASDGILDAFLPDVRFGLMTFDTEPRANKDMSGLWSYFVSTSKQGKPLGCNTPQDEEVGVRNTDAPPWEGRAVGFGNPANGSPDYQSRNAMIQQVLLATRPYGATPIAGMLDDARTYFLNDASADPLDSSFKFGPQTDPALACRHKSIVLLSDGQPNMDLRPFCEPGGCPYDKVEDIAQDLKSKGIEIFVIGFALSSVTVAGVPKACSAFSASDFDESIPTSICKQNPNDQAIQACCALNRIAAAGGHASTGPDDPDWTRARFADDRDQLRSALSQAIGSNFKSTTRTPFVNVAGSGFLSQSSDLAFARSFRFAASFQPSKLDRPWVGALNRARYQCQTVSGVLTPVLLPPDSSKGDKFVDNVNSGGPDARKIFEVIGNAPVVSDTSMRPNLATGVVDGVGTYSGTMNASPKTSTQFVADTPPEAINIDPQKCTLTPTQCRDRYLKWLVGLDNGTIYKRCPTASTCELVSDIYHSIPRAVAGRPSQFLVDSSYQKFVTTELTAKRPSVLYASSNDGFLHAFKILQVDKNDTSETMQVKTKESNELWAFVPPAVLPGLPSLYPATRQRLLDGTPAIKDVVATFDSALPNYKFRLERTLAQAQGGTGEWRTILVQSFGQARPGYFALDITDPVPTGTGGPKFLWQLVTDSGGKPLFGSGGGTPLITTVFIGGKEIAVAILPGGYVGSGAGTAGPSPSNGCSRFKTDWPSTMAPESLTPRRTNRIPCYDDTAIPARSITVVRLDSGEILRTFRHAETEVPGLVGKNVFTKADIDSPMTGQPVAYPADVGAVADRVFIGDQDGALWRLNLTSDTGVTSDWKVDLFVDSLPEQFVVPTGSIAPWHQGQPITSAPIISVNQVGNLTIAFSTGAQDAIGALPGLANYVWSITEVPDATRSVLSAKVNWHLDLTGTLSGDRVIGEMALFNGDLFFATVGPDATNDACSSGSGKVWGMHYTDPNPSGAGAGGRTSTTLTATAGLVGSGGFIDASTLLGTDAHAYLSGVSVAQQPTCDSPGASGDDGFFSYGSQASAGATTPGKYQLIIPTGDKVSNTHQAGVSPINQAGANGVAIDLQQPPVSLVVDSWASIVE